MRAAPEVSSGTLRFPMGRAMRSWLRSTWVTVAVAAELPAVADGSSTKSGYEWPFCSRLMVSVLKRAFGA